MQNSFITLKTSLCSTYDYLFLATNRFQHLPSHLPCLWSNHFTEHHTNELVQYTVQNMAFSTINVMISFHSCMTPSFKSRVSLDTVHSIWVAYFVYPLTYWRTFSYFLLWVIMNEVAINFLIKFWMHIYFQIHRVLWEHDYWIIRIWATLQEIAMLSSCTVQWLCYLHSRSSKWEFCSAEKHTVTLLEHSHSNRCAVPYPWFNLHFLNDSNIEHILICLFAICTYSLEKNLLFFTHFLIGLHFILLNFNI